MRQCLNRLQVFCHGRDEQAMACFDCCSKVFLSCLTCSSLLTDTAVEDSQERCVCPTPCNLTRYGKEISMVRMPNKGSARYLARKYNRNETYIR